MPFTQREIKQRHWDKIYKNASIIKCACGCGLELKDKDKYGRNVRFVNGHNGRKYEDPTQYKREWNYRNRHARMVYKMVYYRRKKVELILYKGGKCKSCLLKYNGKNGALFQFHHRDPSQKIFQLGNQITNRKWTIIIKEVDKCDLLCANCHSLIESKEF